MKVSRWRRRCLADVASDLGVAAGVAVLVAEAAEDLHGGVPLLGRCLLVVGQDLVDDRRETAPARGRFAAGCDGMGLGSECLRIFRTVFRECRNSRAIRLMVMPSR